MKTVTGQAQTVFIIMPSFPSLSFRKPTAGHFQNLLAHSLAGFDRNQVLAKRPTGMKTPQPIPLRWL